MEPLVLEAIKKVLNLGLYEMLCFSINYIGSFFL